jgi:WD40 repeat protein
MDGRLWLWPASGTAGTELKSAHAGPVAKVAALQAYEQAPPAQPASTAAGARRPGLARNSSGSSRTQGGLHAAGTPVLAASCSYDKTIKVWDLAGRVAKQLAVMSGHTAPVLELAVAPGGGALLTGECRRPAAYGGCHPLHCSAHSHLCGMHENHDRYLVCAHVCVRVLTCAHAKSSCGVSCHHGVNET